MTDLPFLFGAAHLLGFASAAHALHQVRTSQGAIGWIVGLIAFPAIALPLYWLGGRTRFFNYREDHQDALKGMDFNLPNDRQLLAEIEGNCPIDAILPSLAPPGYLADNKFRLLRNGSETFQAILKAIAEAKYYILLETYILTDDDIGNQFLDALAEASNRGVDVIMLVDGIGSRQLSESYVRRAEEAGIVFHRFAPHKGLFIRYQLNFRNHRKIVVVDGETGFTGGLNIGDDYVDGGKNFEGWRDTHLEIHGSCVLSLQAVFAKDCWQANRSDLGMLRWPRPTDSGGYDACIIPTGPADPQEGGAALMLTLLTTARERLWIATPFFVPELGIEGALVAASLRGVDVRVLVPDHSESRLADLARESYIDRLSAAGVNFYAYSEGFLHQKVVLIDDLYATVGSLNFDNRSIYLNFEVSAVIRDKDFNQEVAAMLEEDFADSRILEDTTLATKSILHRQLVSVARLFSPVL